MYIPSNIRPYSLEYYEYYDGLDWKGLVYNHYWLIVIIEAALFCESRNERYIRFNDLRKKSNEALKSLTNNENTNLGGTFASIIYSDRCKKFFRVRVKNKNNNRKETRIYPKILAIQNEVKNRKIENLNYGNDRLARIRNKFDIVHRRRPIVEPSVSVSDSLTRQTSKTRTLSNSVQISERLDIVVTRANPKEVPK